MNRINVFENIGFFAVGATGISGIIIYLFKKIFEQQISLYKEKSIYRFSKVYTDRLDIIREVYRRLVKAEYSIEILMRPITIGVRKSEEELENEAYCDYTSLFQYYQENEIIFEDDTITLINDIKNRFDKVWKSYNSMKFMETARGSEPWAKSIENSITVYEEEIVNEIPKLKKLLKKQFQKEFDLLQA